MFEVESWVTLEHDWGMSAPELTSEAHLTVAAVARRLGVAPGTLRTWARRYGVGPTDHSHGLHRRYSEADLARLVHMRKLIIAGVTPQDAAHQSLNHDGPETVQAHHIFNLGSEAELVDQLYRAALSLDLQLLEDGLTAHLDSHKVEESWHSVMVPLLTRVGDEWALSGEGIEVEHLLSGVILRILNARIAPCDLSISPRPVLIASIGDETHSLAITALAAALTERGIPIQFLGSRTPQGAINEVVRKSAPSAIFFWAQLRKNADAQFITGLPAIRPKPVVIVGGPGWETCEVSGANRVDDLIAACADIERAVGL